MPSLRNVPRLVLLASLSLSFALVGPPAGAGGPPKDGPVIPFSPEYARLSVRWWKWALEQPVTPDDPKATNPLVDTTGAAAGNGQPDDVFFLGGLIAFNSGLVAKAERTITIPNGKRVFFPILNVEWDNVGVDPPLSVAGLRQLAAFNVTQVTSLYATVDGEALGGLDGFRAVSPVFDFTYGPNDAAGGSVNLLYYVTGGFYDFTGPVKPAVADGFYVLLKPLKPGKHTITFGGTTKTLDGDGNPATFELDITYHITVGKD